MINYKSGEIIGGIIFIEEVTNGSNSRRMAIFKCPKCGNEFITGISESKSRNTQSCGCHKSNYHALTNSKIYHVWKAMVQRCTNPKSQAYQYYGARGIIVSEEFLNFKNWYDYVKTLDRFEYIDSLKLTLDRIDNHSNYQRGNLRWITMLEQSKT